MGYLYRPKLKDPTPLPPCKHPDPNRVGEKHPDHGRADVCPGCGARFSPVWWAKYYVNGAVVRESTETEKETEAKRFLKDREGSAVKGQPVLPKVDRVTYEEAAQDLRRHYKTTGEREEKEAEGRLKNLDQFFQGRRLSRIGPADVTGTSRSDRPMGSPTGRSIGSWESWAESCAWRSTMTNCCDSRRSKSSRRITSGKASSSGARSRRSSDTCAQTYKSLSLSRTCSVGGCSLKSSR